MEEEKMTEMYELTKENNKMLHAMRRNAFIGGIIKAIFWFVFLVLIPYLSWLYIQPYVQGALETYQNVQDTSNSFKASTSANFSDFQKFFQQFGGGEGK